MEDDRFVVSLAGPLAEGGFMLTSRVLGAVVAGTADIRDSPSTEAADRGLPAQVAAIDRHFATVLSVDIAAARAGPGIRARPHRARGSVGATLNLSDAGRDHINLSRKTPEKHAECPCCVIALFDLRHHIVSNLSYFDVSKSNG